MTSVRRALLFSLLERYALTVLAFASNVLLARLLTPSEIGVYSVCMAVVGIAGVLREFGIGSYLIQKREVTRAHLGTAFGLSLVLGVLLPWDLLLTRLRVSPRARMLAGAGAAAVATGVALRSVHPLLSLPSVPEGPRTVLNYACEAAGYGWVNVIAYLGAVVAGLAFAWLGARARLRADARRAAQAGEDDRPSAEDPAVDEAEGPESREDAEGSADVDETEPRDEVPAVDEAEPSADDGPRPRDETTA